MEYVAIEKSRWLLRGRFMDFYNFINFVHKKIAEVFAPANSY